MLTRAKRMLAHGRAGCVRQGRVVRWGSPHAAWHVHCHAPWALTAAHTASTATSATDFHIMVNGGAPSGFLAQALQL